MGGDAFEAMLERTPVTAQLVGGQRMYRVPRGVWAHRETQSDRTSAYTHISEPTRHRLGLVRVYISRLIAAPMSFRVGLRYTGEDLRRPIPDKEAGIWTTSCSWC